ncbi:hypothetical protein HQN89_33345 [Paenibacillus frigoriresistens]|uniref:DUF5412 family protein n=1 Tax=Paenibacillus alginolyticus TaxID=59839 RepID=UPI0015671DA0|nr:DUF5412 family protein [Paenibacillus frigoriresistens]NRF95716.1 hypothetical protein [Paenibacillus frigoriresistens]
MSVYRKYFPIFLLVVILVVAMWSTLNLFTGLPKGEFQESFPSPSKRYSINIYLVNGGATVDYAIRGELSYKNIFKRNKNIYWNYHEESAEVNWLDEENIVINGRKLNVLTDSFDFRYSK